jgi:hypothetical protein
MPTTSTLHKESSSPSNRSRNLSQANDVLLLDDDDTESSYFKIARRPLQRGEIVPHIPTMCEQMEMAITAATRKTAKSRR